jgi:hypothetical protein
MAFYSGRDYLQAANSRTPSKLPPIKMLNSLPRNQQGT